MPLKLTVFSWAALFASTLLFSGCPHNPGDPDMSPPAVNPVIQLGNPPPDTTNNGVSLAVSDFTRSNLPSNYSIRLIATAADGESNVNTFDAVSNLTWQCSFGRSEVIGTPQNAPLAFTPAITQTPAATSKSMDVVANPITMTGCDTSKPGRGPVNIRGFVRVTATNGAGLPTTSKTFLFDYANVGAL